MLSKDPTERLSCVIVNLGLGDHLEAGNLTISDALMVIQTIRNGDEWGAKHGDTPFPWTDGQIMAKLLTVCMEMNPA